MTNKLYGAKSIIKGSGFINLDADFIASGGELLFIDKDCFLTGLNGSPSTLFIVPDFNFERLPAKLSQEIYKVKKIILQESFSVSLKQDHFYAVPDWLPNFKEIEYVDLRGACLDNLDILAMLPIKHFAFSNTAHTNIEKLVEVFVAFKNLVDVNCDELLYKDLMDGFEKNL
ncbi:hypothetical protein [Pedobacter sp.]|uniref:hypothetical protein n=1 Tax=Pedobacter sp. TaxID=1411316 RepID=UPI0031DCAD28